MIIEKIKLHCAERGISVKGLERELGFGGGTILYWKDHEPGAAKLKKVADYFGVTVDSLLEE